MSEPSLRPLRRLTIWSVRLTTLPMAQSSAMDGRLKLILQRTRRQAMVPRRVHLAAIVVFVGIIGPLAALRPLARAASVSDSAERSHDTQVQLLGVANVSGQENWKADGAALAHPPRIAAGQTGLHLQGTLSPPPGTEIRRFYLSLGVRAGPTAETAVKFVPLAACLLLPPAKSRQLIAAVFPQTQRTCALRYGVASGPWRTAAAVGADLGTVKSVGGSRVTFTSVATPATLLKINTYRDPKTARPLPLLAVTDSLGEAERRVVAVDAAGRRVVLFTSFTDYPSKDVQQLVVLADDADHPLKHIRRLLLQTRAYHWVEFRNIALQPRQ